MSLLSRFRLTTPLASTLRRSTQSAVTSSMVSKRHMSGGAFDYHGSGNTNTADGEFDQDTYNWYLASLAVVPVVGALTLYGVVMEKRHAAHAAAHPKPADAKSKYVFNNVQTKKWPWKNTQCTFWDMDCHKAADLKRKMGGGAH